MSEPERYATAGTNEVAGVVNLQVYFFEQAREAWNRAEQLQPGLVSEPPGWREHMCAALVNAGISLSILLGQNSEPVKDKARMPELESMINKLLPRERRRKAKALVDAYDDIRHFGSPSHESVGGLDRQGAFDLLENVRLGILELLQGKGKDARPWESPIPFAE